MNDEQQPTATDDVPDGIEPPSEEEQLAFLAKNGWTS